MATRKGKCKRITAAFVSRLVFGLHGSLMILLMADALNSEFAYLLLILVALLFVEMVITLKETEKGEWRWFSPVVFLYLCTVIPPTFVLEIGFQHHKLRNDNTTYTELDDKLFPVLLQVLESMVIFVLVIGRWLMPKGHMDRNQLSQLLLTYLALGADMLDVLQIIKDIEISDSLAVFVVGLCLFALAAFQFTIVLTQTVSSKNTSRLEEETQPSSASKKHILYSCCSNEVWSTLITVGMQDGPFLIYRMYLIVAENVYNDSLYFFVMKNFMTVLLEIYKLIAILLDIRRERKKFQQNASEMCISDKEA